MKLKSFIKRVTGRIRDFFKDESGGNIVEYALLIGFALFLFFIIVGVVTSMMDWTVDQSNGFTDIMENFNG